MSSILSPIEHAIGYLMAQIYNVIPSAGLSIIIVTLLLMLLIFPLTHKQTKSMIAMQALQPKVKELQAKHKDDRQKLSEETMALYKEAGVNPLGGCLPMVIQMPFLFSIYRVVRGIENYVGTDTKLFKAICAPAQTLKVCHANAGGLVKAGFSANKAEALADKLPVGKEFFGINLSRNLVYVANQSTTKIIPYIFLIVFLATASYISVSRQQRINPNTPSQMKILRYLFPVGTVVMGVILPGGTNIYILTSTTWRACQQEYLYHKIILPNREKNEPGKKEIEKMLEGDTNYIPGLARQKKRKKK